MEKSKSLKTWPISHSNTTNQEMLTIFCLNSTWLLIRAVKVSPYITTKNLDLLMIVPAMSLLLCDPSQSCYHFSFLGKFKNDLPTLQRKRDDILKELTVLSRYLVAKIDCIERDTLPVSFVSDMKHMT